MQTSGFQPAYQAVQVEVAEADEIVMERLKRKGDRRALYSLRVLHANNQPVLIEKSYLPYYRFKAGRYIPHASA